MELKNIRYATKMRKARRVGRGGKRGNYSGRGMKGQKSRAGAKIYPQIRDLIKRIPKLKGIGFVRPLRRKPAIVNLNDLDRTFRAGEIVSPRTLVEKNLVKRTGGKIPEVKLLGEGTLNKKLLVAQCQASKSAVEKIKSAGGSIAE